MDTYHIGKSRRRSDGALLLEGLHQAADLLLEARHGLAQLANGAIGLGAVLVGCLRRKHAGRQGQRGADEGLSHSDPFPLVPMNGSTARRTL